MLAGGASAERTADTTFVAEVGRREGEVNAGSHSFWDLACAKVLNSRAVQELLIRRFGE